MRSRRDRCPAPGGRGGGGAHLGGVALGEGDGQQHELDGVHDAAAARAGRGTLSPEGFPLLQGREP